MKVEITYRCGHTEQIEVFGTAAERERKIKWLAENHVCSECYKAEQNEKKANGCKEVEMLYKDYKKDYADCDTKADSYDAKAKTIIVYVPEQPAEKVDVIAVQHGQRVRREVRGYPVKVGAYTFYVYRNTDTRRWNACEKRSGSPVLRQEAETLETAMKLVTEVLPNSGLIGQLNQMNMDELEAKKLALPRV